MFITGYNSFQSTNPLHEASTMTEKKDRATQKMRLSTAISKVIPEMDDGNVDSVNMSSANLRGLFTEFCAAQDAYVLTLTNGNAIETSVTYYDEVFNKYRSTMRQVRTFMASPEQATEP